MLRVGLTGSIAVGKSFVTCVLGELGCHVLDADQIARAVVEKDAPGLSAVVKAFGQELLREDGTLDRQKLGEIIFSNQKQRELLNSILHPYIIAAQDEQMHRWEKEDPDGIAVIDAALMIESGGYRRFDKLIVVYCRPEIQLQRIMSRTSLSEEQALQRIHAQMSQEDKKRFADYLVDTSEGFEAARKQTTSVYERLLQDNSKAR